MKGKEENLSEQTLKGTTEYESCANVNTTVAKRAKTNFNMFEKNKKLNLEKFV
ncbi:MAG: hypothetical protein ACK4SO_08025 [Candidatus Kapaibacteriota bacterium]